LLIIIIIKYKDEPEEDGVLLGVPTAGTSLSMSKLSPSISWELCLQTDPNGSWLPCTDFRSALNVDFIFIVKVEEY
jgi:hypothetical protein